MNISTRVIWNPNRPSTGGRQQLKPEEVNQSSQTEQPGVIRGRPSGALKIHTGTFWKTPRRPSAKPSSKTPSRAPDLSLIREEMRDEDA